MSKQSDRRLFKRADIIVIAVILSVCLVAFILKLSGEKSIAVITVDGKTVKTVDLEAAEDEVFFLDTSPVSTVEIKDGKIRFINSKCRDHTCENSGFLYRPGDTAACLPAKAVITVSGKSDSVDAHSF